MGEGGKGKSESCAIGMAVLDAIEEEGLQKHAAVIVARLLAELNELKSRHGIIGDVKGIGLFIGIELVQDRDRHLPSGEPLKWSAV